MEGLRTTGRHLLESLWDEVHGFTRPSERVYPWQWLWDSCFHALIWSELGDRRRAARELATLLAAQLPSGFVPHMAYHGDASAALPLWGVAGRSVITQPPMWGHALRVMAEHGQPAPQLHAAATAGIEYFFNHRLDPGSGLIVAVHPWETGCDNSNRWDAWLGGHWDRAAWDTRKRELVESLVIVDGGGEHNPGFEVGSVGLSALVAFNALELAAVTGDRALRQRAETLVSSIARRWRPELRTWADAVVAGPNGSAATNTLDALLPLLVVRDPAQRRAAVANLLDPTTFWRPHGPAGTAANVPTYDPDQYWRGPAWPQLIYLLMIATDRGGEPDVSRRLARRLIDGARSSRMSEFWNPETGAGRGAQPQAWTALSVMAGAALGLRRGAADLRGRRHNPLRGEAEIG